MARVIQEHIKKPLADELLFGKLENGGTVKVLVEGKGEDSKLAFEFIPADPSKKPKTKEEDEEDDEEAEAALVEARAEEGAAGAEGKEGKARLARWWHRALGAEEERRVALPFDRHTGSIRRRGPQGPRCCVSMVTGLSSRHHGGAVLRMGGRGLG